MAKNSKGDRYSVSSIIPKASSLSLNTSNAESSASSCAMEREILALKTENTKLRKHLKETRSLYEQLTKENSHEKFDERRVTLLKSQIIQLERQIMLMSEALSSRTVILSEVENALASLSNKWRDFIGMEVKGPDIKVARAEIMDMVHIAESARIKLYKNIENSTLDNLAQPLLFVNKFVQPHYKEDLTLLDVAAGNLKHLNLAHVSNLETKLASLYKDLMHLQAITEDSARHDASPVTISNHISHAIKDRYSTQLLKSCARIKDCCGDLVLLSLLYPSAPWPPLNKKCFKDITCERVMQSLPTLPKTKVEEIKRTVESLLKAFNHKLKLQLSQIKGLQEEVKFHKTVYNLQISYSDSLIDAVRKGYVEFEKSTVNILLNPLKDVMEAYVAVKSSPFSDGTFRNFLAVFERNEEKLASALDQLMPHMEDDVSAEALSQFGEDFNEKLSKMVQKTQMVRDRSAKDIEELKDIQRQMEEELRELLDAGELNEHEILHQNTDDIRSHTPEHEDTKGKFSNADLIETADQPQQQSHRDVSKEIKKSTGLKERPPWVNLLDDKSEPIQHEDLIYRGETFHEENNQTSKVHEDENKKSRGSVRKKPPSYSPNTFVPNRTLHLKRANSQTKINQDSQGRLNDKDSGLVSHSSVDPGRKDANSSVSYPAEKSDIRTLDENRDYLPKITKTKKVPKVWK